MKNTSMKRVVLAAFVGVLLLQPGNARISAQGGSPLTFFKNYFITGDYVVGGASLSAEEFTAIVGYRNVTADDSAATA